jgi:hypothetical protein
VTFKQRLDRFRSTAKRFFAARDLKGLEAQFQTICDAAEGFWDGETRAFRAWALDRFVSTTPHSIVDGVPFPF